MDHDDEAADASTEAVLAEAGAALFAALADKLGDYVAQAVLARLSATGRAPDERERQAAHRAGARAEAAVLGPLRSLLAADVDAQRSTPLTLVRRALDEATEALTALGVPAVPRDRFSRERFPSDAYGLYPASLAVLGNDVEELAITWGAAKALAHRRRHLRSEH